MKAEVLQKTTSRKILPSWYYDAFAMKLKGYKYDQIAERVNKHPVTVRSLFTKHGAFYSFWMEWLENNKMEELDDAIAMTFGHVADAMRTHIIAGQNPKSIVGLEARRDIFAYTLGKPEQRVKLDAKVGIFNFGDWALAQTESIKAKQNGTESTRETITGVPEESS